MRATTFRFFLKKAVDRTLHFDRFFSLRTEKTGDSRNGGKKHENKTVFFGKPLPGWHEFLLNFSDL